MPSCLAMIASIRDPFLERIPPLRRTASADIMRSLEFLMALAASFIGTLLGFNYAASSEMIYLIINPLTSSITFLFVKNESAKTRVGFKLSPTESLSSLLLRIYAVSISASLMSSLSSVMLSRSIFFTHVFLFSWLS